MNLCECREVYALILRLGFQKNNIPKGKLPLTGEEMLMIMGLPRRPDWSG